MRLTEKNKKVLEEIIELDGSCLSATRCNECPFSKECLVKFPTGKPWPKAERRNRAADTITRFHLLGEYCDE